MKSIYGYRKTCVIQSHPTHVVQTYMCHTKLYISKTSVEQSCKTCVIQSYMSETCVIQSRPTHVVQSYMCKTSVGQLCPTQFATVRHMSDNFVQHRVTHVGRLCTTHVV